MTDISDIIKRVESGLVKPLEWTNYGGSLWSATCPHTFLNYAVMTRSSGLTEWRGALDWTDALSEDAGKQCAQASHDSRVLSAITISPDDIRALVDALREAERERDAATDRAERAERLLAEARKALEPFSQFPLLGIHGGPLCIVKGIYEDGTDENTARHRGLIAPSHFRAARAIVNKEE